MVLLLCVDQKLHKKTRKIQEIVDIYIFEPLASSGVIIILCAVSAVLIFLGPVVAIDALLAGHNVRFPSIHGNVSHDRGGQYYCRKPQSSCIACTCNILFIMCCDIDIRIYLLEPPNETPAFGANCERSDFSAKYV